MTGLIKSRFVKGQVVAVTHWDDEYHSIKIAAPGDPFQPGQFVRLQLSIGDELIARSYSLVNSPDEPGLEILFNTVPNGKFSNALASLRSGDEIEVSQPANGFFVLDEVPPTQELWMFATGTGIGPYISMLRDGTVWERFQRCVLVHSVSRSPQLAYRSEIHEKQTQHAEHFHYLPCVTQEPFNDGLPSRFTEALDNGELETALGFELEAEKAHVMLCGNHHMLEDMKTRLAQRGMQKHLRHKPGHITTEQYF